MAMVGVNNEKVNRLLEQAKQDGIGSDLTDNMLNDIERTQKVWNVAEPNATKFLQRFMAEIDEVENSAGFGEVMFKMVGELKTFGLSMALQNEIVKFTEQLDTILRKRKSFLGKAKNGDQAKAEMIRQVYIAAILAELIQQLKAEL